MTIRIKVGLGFVLGIACGYLLNARTGRAQLSNHVYIDSVSTIGGRELTHGTRVIGFACASDGIVSGTRDSIHGNTESKCYVLSAD